jgi:hypothetical protein
VSTLFGKELLEVISDARGEGGGNVFHHSILLIVKKIAAATRKISKASRAMSFINLPNVSRSHIIV